MKASQLPRKIAEQLRQQKFLAELSRLKLQLPEMEYKFHPKRQWRFDYAWPDLKIALEQEGGVWTRGRHTRGAGFVADLEKYNRAAISGWTVIRVTVEQMDTLEAVTLLREVLV